MNLKWNAKNTVGLLIGIASPFVILPITMAIIAWTQNYYFSQLMYKFSINTVLQSKLISLSIIPNLLWFYLFLNKERYSIARGIIIGSALFLPYMAYINLFR